MNRIEIFDAVRAMSNRPNLSNNDLSVMMAMIEGEMNRGLSEHPRNLRRTEWTIPTKDANGVDYTEDTNIIPLPTDIATLVVLMGQDGSVYQEYPPALRNKVIDCAYIERGDCLEVFPTPQRGTTFYLDYRSFLRMLQEDLDTNWVSTYFPDLYIYGMLKQVAIFTKDTQNLPGWVGEFTRVMSEVQLQGWNQNIGSSPQMRNG